MARGAARAIHCSGEAVTLGPCDDGQFVKRQGNKLVGAEVVGGGAAWGDITGTLGSQTDLQGALDGKEDAGTAAAAVAAHEAAGDPHTAYLTAGEADLLYEAAGAVTAHAGQADPHPGYLTPAEGNAAYEAAGAVATHAAAADPHTGYQKESEKGAANGYASLGADGKVPSAQLPASGGSPFMFEGMLAADVSTGANTTPVNVTGLVFTFAANKNYVIELFGTISAAAATTGIGLQFDVSAAVTQVAMTFFHQLANTGTLSGGNSIADDASAGVSSGIAANGAIVPVYASGILRAGASTGTAQLRLRSETTAVCTIKAGTIMRVRELP